MKTISHLYGTIRHAPDWLGEREALRSERQILDVLRRKPWLLDRALDEVSTLGALDQSNAERSAQLLNSGARRLVTGLYDRYVRLPAPARAPLRLILRAVLAFSPARAASQAPSRTPEAQLADRAVAVPFAEAFPKPQSARPVAAVIHIFYPDLAADIRDYLKNAPGVVDLFISTDTEIKRQAILAAFSGWDRGGVEVRLAPNRGRDIAPKLITFRDVYDRYEIVLHLHSKKSPHDSYLRLWRYFTYETLLGDPRIVENILAAFEREPSIGMIAAQHFYPLKAGIVWGGNFAMAQGPAGRMGIPIRPDGALDFPSGSMFWARSAALRPLLDLDLSADDFPDEKGQDDNTLAHAIERLYFHVCEAAGFRWLKIARPELAHSTDRPPVPIEDPAALHGFVETMAGSLGSNRS